METIYYLYFFGRKWATKKLKKPIISVFLSKELHCVMVSKIYIEASWLQLLNVGTKSWKLHFLGRKIVVMETRSKKLVFLSFFDSFCYNTPVYTHSWELVTILTETREISHLKNIDTKKWAKIVTDCWEIAKTYLITFSRPSQTQTWVQCCSLLLMNIPVQLNGSHLRVFMTIVPIP